MVNLEPCTGHPHALPLSFTFSPLNPILFQEKAKIYQDTMKRRDKVVMQSSVVPLNPFFRHLF
jgi:hypothetical protein